MIGDARTITRLSLADWLKHDKIVKLLRQRGFRPPLLGIMAEPGHEPAVAIVNHGSWKAICPDPGCPGAEDIWREGPYLFYCCTCGNRAVGGHWRRLVVPPSFEAVEVPLLKLPRTQQHWHPEAGNDVVPLATAGG